MNPINISHLKNLNLIVNQTQKNMGLENMLHPSNLNLVVNKAQEKYEYDKHA